MVETGFGGGGVASNHPQQVVVPVFLVVGKTLSRRLRVGWNRLIVENPGPGGWEVGRAWQFLVEALFWNLTLSPHCSAYFLRALILAGWLSHLPEGLKVQVGLALGGRLGMLSKRKCNKELIRGEQEIITLLLLLLNGSLYWCSVK